MRVGGDGVMYTLRYACRYVCVMCPPSPYRCPIDVHVYRLGGGVFSRLVCEGGNRKAERAARGREGERARWQGGDETNRV